MTKSTGTGEWNSLGGHLAQGEGRKPRDAVLEHGYFNLAMGPLSVINAAQASDEQGYRKTRISGWRYQAWLLLV